MPRKTNEAEPSKNQSTSGTSQSSGNDNSENENKLCEYIPHGLRESRTFRVLVQ